MKERPAKAAFLDRDGVINVDKGYIHTVEDFEFIDGVFQACRRLNALGYAIVIVTNQSGIGRGYFTDADYQRVTEWMLQRFKNEGVVITAVYYCPYHPRHGVGQYKQDSPYRKPGPQMLLDAAAHYRLDLRASFVAGDKVSDIQAGHAAGVGEAYLIGSADILPGELQGIGTYSSLLALVEAEFPS